ncbi:hypothetical protein ACFFRR_008843 [Megaselia abdita]
MTKQPLISADPTFFYHITNVLGDWRDALQTQGEGIMHSYQTLGTIDNNSKTQLAKLVIQYELGDFESEVPKITPQRLQELAREIVAEFPNEDELTYYIIRGQRGNHCPMGKLYEAYRGVQRRFSKTKKRKTKK